MSDDTPTLEVGFAIHTGGSYTELERLRAIMNSTEGTALKAAAAVEKQFADLGMTRATAQVTAFGSAATRELENVRFATNSAEKSAEGMIRQLERQASTFGKSASEIRQMRAELKATEADSRGLTEVAARLRAASAEMDRLEGANVRLAGSAKRGGTALQTVAVQLPDITQGLLTGQKPMQVFIQQGFQIVQMAQMSQGGLRGFGQELGVLALRFAPLLAVVAAAGAGIALFNRWVNQGVDSAQLTRGLGEITGGADATKQELYKLKDATVSFASTSEALFSVLGKDIAAVFVGDMKGMGKDVKSVLDDLTSYGRTALAGLYAGVAGLKAYMGEISSRGGLMKAVAGDPTLLDRTFGASFRTADKYLGDLGRRVRTEAIKIEREKLADKIGFNNAPKPKTDSRAETLAREAEAVEAQIRNLYELAKAYDTSGAAALIAEARVKAESDAIKKRGDIEAMVDRQIRLAIAQRVSDASKAAAVTREQARIQAEVNGEVAAGNVPAERAAQLVQQRIAELPLLAAIEVAQQRGLAKEAQLATDALNRQRSAAEDARASGLAAQFNLDEAAANRQLEVLREELRLVGETEAVRARALALARATQEAEQKFGKDIQFAKDAAAKQMEVYDATVAVRDAQRDVNEALTFNAERWDLIARNVQDGARGMADAFGDVGRAIGDMAAVYADYRAEQERNRAVHLANLADAKTRSAVDRENAKYALATGSAQIRLYGDMAASAKGFFKERSAAYKSLAIAEKAYRAIQFAMSVQAMVQDARETIMSVLNSGKRSIAAGTEGVANQSKLPFPYNVVAMAATAAALVSAGVAVFGGGGGGAPPPKSAEDYQKEQGTGSVLGDGSAKSESIGKSLALMERNSNKDLEYSSEMVRALRAIETGISGLAAAVSRQLSAGGGLDASSLQLGTNTSGGLLGSGLFSKKITRELNDAGLQFDGTSVAQAIAGGIQANLYQEVLKTTKKSGFLGIGGSTKTSIETTRTAADAGLTTEVALLIGNMRKAIVEAAGTIGIDGAAAMLDAFQINIGRISFKDLTAEEIESELAAVFSRVGDDMAGAVGGGLSAFQRAGEGMLETLMRLAKEYQTVDVALRSIGMTFGAVGLASVGARTALVDLFGGLDAFTEQTAFFRENFLSEAEQMAPVIAAVKAEMERLGLAGVTTKDAFKSVVLGLDLSTERGRETYAALMAVAPAFAKTSDYLASLNGELKETAKTAEQLAAIEKQRRALDIQLMEATGNTAAALAAKRADELAAMDESLRGLQQQVWSALDAAQAQRELAAANEEASRAAAAAADEAARTAAAIAQQRRGLEIALMEAMGDAAGALAARRGDELAGMDASLRALQEQVWAAEAATAAQAALAEAQAAAAQTATALAQQRRSMEIELMEALGDAAGALAARRADELAGTDASLRALREQIYSAQDAAAANAALAQAQDNAAQAARTAADAAAQLARQRAGLEIALMRAQGQEAQAVSAERALELDALDASLRGLQAQVWAAEDARAAAEAAARAQADMLSAAKQAADDAEQLRKQRVGLQVELLDAMGDAAGALALRRAEELAAMDASLRGMQQMVWRQQDIAAAVSKARDTLTESYKRESDALTETIDRFGGFGESLRKFRGELGMGDSAVGDAYRVAQARFVDASSLAAIGDAKALGELEGISKEFLAASRDRAGSLAEYQRDVARVAGSVDRAIGGTDEAVDYAQAQLEALKSSVAGLVDINENVVSVRDAILALRDAEAGRSVPAVPAVPVTAMTQSAQPVQVSTAALERRIDALSDRLEVLMLPVAENTGKAWRFFDQWTVDGLPTRPADED